MVQLCAVPSIHKPKRGTQSVPLLAKKEAVKYTASFLFSNDDRRHRQKGDHRRP
ncbi:MAG: hypothetical protein RLZZ139_2966 [Cyanobacteriota bacterium]|jgi:hypothetical protein